MFNGACGYDLSDPPWASTGSTRQSIRPRVHCPRILLEPLTYSAMDGSGASLSGEVHAKFGTASGGGRPTPVVGSHARMCGPACRGGLQLLARVRRREWHTREIHEPFDATWQQARPIRRWRHHSSGHGPPLGFRPTAPPHPGTGVRNTYVRVLGGDRHTRGRSRRLPSRQPRIRAGRGWLSARILKRASNPKLSTAGFLPVQSLSPQI